jgi:hypothetical protein
MISASTSRKKQKSSTPSSERPLMFARPLPPQTKPDNEIAAAFHVHSTTVSLVKNQEFALIHDLEMFVQSGFEDTSRVVFQLNSLGFFKEMVIMRYLTLNNEPHKLKNAVTKHLLQLIPAQYREQAGTKLSSLKLGQLEARTTRSLIQLHVPTCFNLGLVYLS